MTSPLPDNWRTQLEKLSLDTDNMAEPAGENTDWYQVFMSFATHGFVMVYLQAEGNGVHAQVHCALPNKAPKTTFHDGLLKELARFGGKTPHLSAEGPPSIIHTTFGDDVGEHDIASMLTMCLKISDYISAVESDSTAALPFAQTEQVEADASTKEAEAEEEDEGNNTAFVFESIGAGTNDDSDAEPKPKQEPTKRAHSAFEQIGTDKPTESTSENDQPADLGEICLKAYSVTEPRRTMRARLTLTDTIEGSARRHITQGFIKNLEVRYDITVSAGDAERHDEIELNIEAASKHLGLEDRDREDIESYFDRLVRFGKMGVTLAESLDISGEQPRRSSRSDNTARTTLVDIPSKRHNRQQEESSDNTGVVLDLSGDSTPEGNEPLVSKRFDDPRIKRPDATTPLVDVVLRHPGYSDKRIGQVLSILLSIEYSRALELIEEAPVVISWGISRERALTFKNAIEGAGGRAILVEPGTFKPS